MLVSGFVSLSQGVQVYHWQLIVYIAWFSSVTHLCAITVLRSYLRERRVETSVRFGLMICLLIMLLVAFIPTAFFDWENVGECSAAIPSSPAICFFDIARGRKLAASVYKTYLDDGFGHMLACADFYEPQSNFSSATQAMILALLLLSFGFVSRSIKLFKPLSMAFHMYLRRPFSKRAQQGLMWILGLPKEDTTLGSTRPGSGSNGKSYFKVLRQPCVAVFLSLRITADLLGSMLAEVRSPLRAVFVFGSRLIA